jgi:hypothetical protein
MRGLWSVRSLRGVHNKEEEEEEEGRRRRRRRKEEEKSKTPSERVRDNEEEQHTGSQQDDIRATGAEEIRTRATKPHTVCHTEILKQKARTKGEFKREQYDGCLHDESADADAKRARAERVRRYHSSGALLPTTERTCPHRRSRTGSPPLCTLVVRGFQCQHRVRAAMSVYDQLVAPAHRAAVMSHARGAPDVRPPVRGLAQ